MFNLFDILQAQGSGANGVGQQFGLTPEQSRRALEALLPAFAIGLQRNAANDPMGLAQMFGLASGKPAAPPQADMLMGQIFGPQAVSQAVIRQAAAASGIASPVLRQMMPILAGMVAAGIVHMMLNPPAAAAPAAAPGFGLPPNPFWPDMAGGLSSPAAAPTLRPSAPPPGKPRGASPKGAASGGTAFDMLQTMLQSGIDAHEQNVRAMQGIFDSVWSAKPPPAPPSNDAEPARAAAPKRV